MTAAVLGGVNIGGLNNKDLRALHQKAAEQRAFYFSYCEKGNKWGSCKYYRAWNEIAAECERIFEARGIDKPTLSDYI